MINFAYVFILQSRMLPNITMSGSAIGVGGVGRRERGKKEGAKNKLAPVAGVRDFRVGRQFAR
jgi:hypothetical protein